MNGRAPLTSTSPMDKNLHYNNIKYVKPTNFMNNEYKQQQSHNLYYDSNPYLINGNPHGRSRGIYTTSRNNNPPSRENSEASSQRSGKVVRANGLKIAQKPKFLKDRVVERHYSNHSHNQNNNMEQSKKLFERNTSLEQQNKQLHNEVRRLNEKMKKMEQDHNQEVASIERRFKQILLKAEGLQRQMQEGEKQWRLKLEELNKPSNNNLGLLVSSQESKVINNGYNGAASYIVKR